MMMVMMMALLMPLCYGYDDDDNIADFGDSSGDGYDGGCVIMAMFMMMTYDNQSAVVVVTFDMTITTIILIVVTHTFVVSIYFIYVCM